MKTSVCIAVLVACALAAPEAGRRDKRSPWGASLGYSAYSLGAPLISHEPLLYSAPAIVSVKKIVSLPRVVSVRKVVSYPHVSHVARVSHYVAPRVSYSYAPAYSAGWCCSLSQEVSVESQPAAVCLRRRPPLKLKPGARAQCAHTSPQTWTRSRNWWCYVCAGRRWASLWARHCAGTAATACTHVTTRSTRSSRATTSPTYTRPSRCTRPCQCCACCRRRPSAATVSTRRPRTTRFTLARPTTTTTRPPRMPTTRSQHSTRRTPATTKRRSCTQRRPARPTSPPSCTRGPTPPVAIRTTARRTSRPASVRRPQTCPTSYECTSIELLKNGRHCRGTNFNSINYIPC